jgi:hypothetical protein
MSDDDRLSVNITRDTKAALEQVAKREGVTETEALRRLVGYGALLYRVSVVDGDEILIRKDGKLTRVRLMLEARNGR